ncbi:MAG: penicillin-binding protein 2 [Pyrinomonadaceae bacterium]
MAARKTKKARKDSMQTAFTRFMLVVAFFIFWIGAVCVRLVHLQVKEHAKWDKMASSQRQDTFETKSLRGTIFDRSGNALAMSIRVKSLSADPVMINDPIPVAKELGPIIGEKPEKIVAEIKDAHSRGKRFLWIARELEDEQVKEIEKRVFNANAAESGVDLGEGLFWVGEQKRDYPHGTLASHVIGFSNSDDIGQAGVEKSQEEILRAQKLRTVRQRDRQGRVFAETETDLEPPKDVQITISKEVQHLTEAALEKGVKRANARSGKAIVLDPKSGEILAMANYPTFSPSDFRKLKPGSWRNSAIQDQYAPGSVFKLITYSAALEEGLIAPDSTVDCGNGTITVGGHTFTDSHSVGNVTYSKAMAESSNVGAIKTGLKIGREKYYHYAKLFGFGSRTGVGLPSEAGGVLRNPKDWQGTDLASLSIGYGIDVTALQTAVAFATIANDGVRVEPRIVSKITQEGEEVESFEAQSERIVSVETARKVKKMLVEVVKSGTAKAAQVDGYSSAGKTGTAWKFDREAGGINESKYISSFAGFAPVDAPVAVILVVIDEPKGAARNGGQVAAPVFREITEGLMSFYRINPDLEIDIEGEDSPAGDSKTEQPAPHDSNKPEPAPSPKERKPRKDTVDAVSEPKKKNQAPVAPNANKKGLTNVARENENKGRRQIRT